MKYKELSEQFWKQFSTQPLKMKIKVFWWAIFSKKRLYKFLEDWNRGKAMKPAFRDANNL
jgi:hypothetical protein